MRRENLPRRDVRRWLSACLLASLVLAAAAASVAGFTEKGTVTIHDGGTDAEQIVGGEPLVCTFHFHFQLTQQKDILAWEVRTWAKERFDGTVVLSGVTSTDPTGAARVPDAGNLSVSAGRYNIIWDEENPIEDSSGVRSFRVDCAAPAPAASPSPAASAAGSSPSPSPAASAAGSSPSPSPSPTGDTAAASPSPTGAVAGIVATPGPTGGVVGIGGTPSPTGETLGAGLTPPPTNTSAPRTTAVSNISIAIILLAGLVALAVVGARVSRLRT